MDADGKNRRVLPLWGIYGWSMSRGGRFVAYQAVDLMTMNVDGRPRYRRVIRNVGTGFNLDWSWNSRSIAFERRPDIWIVNLNDHRQRRIVRNGQSPRWSPDGRKLTFERPRGQVVDLWIVDVVTKRERRLVRNGYSADWSPDGREIVFERCRTDDCFIYVMRADGTSQRRLFKGQDPAWSPTGHEIAFLGVDARRSYNDAVIRARLDGSDRRVLFGQLPYCGCGEPFWARSPRGR
jgi:Tol biopolymer transport system component